MYIDSYCLLWDVIDTKFLVFPSFYGLVWLTHRPAGTHGDWKSMCVCINNAYHLQLSHIFNDAIIHLLYTVVEWIICSVNNRDNYGRRTMKWSLSINFNKQTQIYTFTNLHIDRLAFCQRYIVQVYRYRSKKCLGVCVWGGGGQILTTLTPPQPTNIKWDMWTHVRLLILISVQQKREGVVLFCKPWKIVEWTPRPLLYTCLYAACSFLYDVLFICTTFVYWEL